MSFKNIVLKEIDLLPINIQELLYGKQAEIDGLRRRLAEKSVADAKAQAKKQFADQCLRDAMSSDQTQQDLGDNATSDEKEAMRRI
jgi:hypothetical protein